MAKAKVWYKHIKPGDYLLIKFGPKAVWAMYSNHPVIFHVKEVPSKWGNRYTGYFFDRPDKRLFAYINFDDPEIEWGDVNFIRKVSEWEVNEIMGAKEK